MAIEIRLNGEAVAVDAEAEMPLLWVLRDVLGCTGTKFGCGIGQCGACTIHLDGVPVRGCLTPLAAAEGRAITTIEGLDPNGAHPLQQAWVANSVPQCGYCQSGQLMTAAAFLESNPDPSPREIETAMSGNICRCGTYDKIRKAVRDAADAMQTPSNDAADGPPTKGEGASHA